MIDNGYVFTRDDFPLLLTMQRYPEQTVPQTEIFRAYFQNHLNEFDRVIFEYRVGTGLAPDPTHLPAIQENTVRSTQQRIDLLCWAGLQPTIVECKGRVTPSSLGQILTYRLLLKKELPDAAEPELIIIGRYSDTETIESITSHGVKVFLYAEAVAGVDAAGGGV